MVEPVERRQMWSRIIGVERRKAPMAELNGHKLPDPTRLEDEEFIEAQLRLLQEREETLARRTRWNGPTS